MSVTASDFEYVRRLVADDSALALSDGKEYLVQTRLAPLAAREGLGSVGELIERVRGGAPELRREIVEALATGETLWFRDAHPFETLRESVIPDVLSANGGQRLSIWSAAASTGQEVYSIALILREHFPHLSDLTLLATDLSNQALARARQGRYSQLEVGRGLPANLLVRHFDQHGREWQLHDDVRRMVSFRQLNLSKRLIGIPRMDVVFLRNVLIYFDDGARASLLAQIGEILRPGGYLFLGGAESVLAPASPFERVQLGRTILYRRSAT